jgi:hypothetical protein
MRYERSLSVNEWMGKLEAVADKKAGVKPVDGKKNWFLRPVVGKIPGYGVVLGGAGLVGVLTGLGYAVKRYVMKK